MIHTLFTTEGIFEVTIESWPEWDLCCPKVTVMKYEGFGMSNENYFYH